MASACDKQVDLFFLKRSALIDAALEQAKQGYSAEPDGNQHPGSFLIHIIHFVHPFVSHAGMLLLLYVILSEF